MGEVTFVNVLPRHITYMNAKFMYILVVTGLTKLSQIYVIILIILGVFPEYRPVLKFVALPYLLS